MFCVQKNIQMQKPFVQFSKQQPNCLNVSQRESSVKVGCTDKCQQRNLLLFVNNYGSYIRLHNKSQMYCYCNVINRNIHIARNLFYSSLRETKQEPNWSQYPYHKEPQSTCIVLTNALIKLVLSQCLILNPDGLLQNYLVALFQH